MLGATDLQTIECQWLSETDRLRYANRDISLKIELRLTSMWYNADLIRAWRITPIKPAVALFLIIVGSPRRSIGTVSFTSDKGSVTHEIGFAVTAPYRNQGIASTALQLAMTEFSRINSVAGNYIAHLSVANVASRKVLQKAGFKRSLKSEVWQIETWVFAP